MKDVIDINEFRAPAGRVRCDACGFAPCPYGSHTQRLNKVTRATCLVGKTELGRAQGPPDGQA